MKTARLVVVVVREVVVGPQVTTARTTPLLVLARRNSARVATTSPATMAQQVFVRVLDGRTRCLLFDDDASRDEGVSVARLARELERLEGIPSAEQIISCGSRVLRPADGRLPLDPPTCHLLLPLAGGKGGFGSNLRAAARNAATSNFDACRDLSGRRVRHVNGEQKIRDFAARAEERELEAAALRHINSAENQTKRKFSEIEAEERERYAREAADTVAGTAEATRLGLAAAERADADAAARADAARAAEKAATRRVCGYMHAGLGGISDDSEDESDEETPRTDSVARRVGKRSRGEGGKAPEVPEARVPEVRAPARTPPASEPGGDGGASGSGGGGGGGASDAAEETIDPSAFASATELERFGLDRLRDELAARGLKCGGTLAQRAERLFLLKNNEVEELDKKHLAPRGKR